MAKKQRHDQLSQESRATVTDHHCAAAVATENDSTTAPNFLGLFSSGQELFWDVDPNLTTVGPGLMNSTYDLNSQFPFVDSGLNATEFMHRQMKTEPEKDNTGQQPEALVADNLVVASSASFPDNWFESQFFVNTSTSNQCNFSLPSPSAGMGSSIFATHPTVRVAGAEDSLKRRMQTQVTAAAGSPALADSLQISENPGLMQWKPKITTQCPSTSSTDQQHEPSSNKRRKKRPSGATADVFGDSDGSDDDDDDDEDDDDGSVSDIEEDEGAIRTSFQHFAAKFLELRSMGKPCNFWQYNSQARGPKGRRIYGEITLKDCHVLDEFSDPVTYSGNGKGQPNKLRHGEGNDPRPDTIKLMEIGSRISHLEDEFRRLAGVKSGNKDKIGRQKNKLASRICRLKKKAQHEANKIKLEGLREEHEQLVAVVAKLVTIMETHFLMTKTTGATSLVGSQPLLCSQLETLIQAHLKFMIAGHACEYVNMQLQKAAERLGSTSRTHLNSSSSYAAATCC